MTEADVALRRTLGGELRTELGKAFDPTRPITPTAETVSAQLDRLINEYERQLTVLRTLRQLV